MFQYSVLYIISCIAVLAGICFTPNFSTLSVIVTRIIYWKNYSVKVAAPTNIVFPQNIFSLRLKYCLIYCWDYIFSDASSICWLTKQRLCVSDCRGSFVTIMDVYAHISCISKWYSWLFLASFYFWLTSLLRFNSIIIASSFQHSLQGLILGMKVGSAFSYCLPVFTLLGLSLTIFVSFADIF